VQSYCFTKHKKTPSCFSQQNSITPSYNSKITAPQVKQKIFANQNAAKRAFFAHKESQAFFFVPSFGNSTQSLQIQLYSMNRLF
jgi:hypothetical protein